MKQLTRRRFLSQTAAAGAAVTALPILGQDGEGRYKTALIGCGWWGMNILGEAMAAGRSRVVGLCDVDRRHLDAAAAVVQEKTGDQPRLYGDFRELLAHERPEIVIVATPDHWHPLATIEAVRQGAHVYVEKPISHTILEGRAMVKAARKYGRTVQVGTHRRASPHNISGMEFLRSGKAGKIGMVRAFVHYGGGPEKPQANEEPPAELDWNLWCGPAPLRPFNSRIHPRGFRQFLDYGNGTLGDWGIHWMDQILWWTEERYPRRVFSTGGRPIKGPAVNLPDYQTTDAPDHQVAAFEFESFTATWEHRQFAGNNAEKGESVGCYFYGTKGTLHMGWKSGWTFHPANGNDPVLHEEPTLHLPDQQNIKELWADFLAAIREERHPICDIEIGHRSTTMSLLGMLSLKLGRSVEWDGERERIVGDDYANLLLRREYRPGYTYPDLV
ncbi:MAG: Gfo/Idh/MocA family oxidoreductase [Verrucomicrobiales bacterium]|nr:Gfo/Idh/MocA family oxidoreductase [Verrucomicrobiales bacterium]MCP5526307.1 Gfo/Idh/MocA family oxidoreductase [Verrucomicrobiales bacterium]